MALEAVVDGGTNALRVCWAGSGEILAVWSAEEFDALVEERGNTALALKRELMSRGVGSRFRLRLVHVEDSLETG